MSKNLRNNSVDYNGQYFDWKESVKYLGIHLDQKLTFKHHIDKSINKASSASFSSLYCLINRNSPASQDSKLRIYKSYIRPILTYACPIFTNAAACHLKKLQIFQNKILRMIQNVIWTDFKSIFFLGLFDNFF